MANYTKCIEKLSEAAGRALTDDEIEAIYMRIHKAALDIKAGRIDIQDVQTGKLGGAGDDIRAGTEAEEARVLIQRAADLAATELEREAKLTEFRTHLQLARLAARMKEYDDLVTGGTDPHDAIKFMIARDYSGKVNIESVEQRVAGHRTNMQRQLLETWDSFGNDFLGFFQDKEKLLLLVRELRGETTGDAMARKGADAFHKVAEGARRLFNDNGGNIGKLDDWSHPQHHSQRKVALAAGRNSTPDQSKAQWVAEVMPLIDRGRYIDDVTGIQKTDAEMEEFLGHAWESIATDGWSKVIPGKSQGSGSMANRHSQQRQIHFKDADSTIAYWEKYGEKTVFEILNDHVEVMARDIAWVEKFGPNPQRTFQSLRDTATKTAVEARPVDVKVAESKAMYLDNLFGYGSGQGKPTYREWLKSTMDGIMHLNVAGKLGGAALASFFGDKPMMEAVAHMNNQPAVRRWMSEMSLLNPVNARDRRLIQQQGLMLETIRSGLQRFYDGLGNSSFPGKMANAVMKLTGMTAINEIRKGAFGLNLMAGIGNELAANRTFKQLTASDVRTLRNYGITEADWNIWRLAERDTIAGVDNVLTPEAISRITDEQIIQAGIAPRDATPEKLERIRRNGVVKLLGAVSTESDFAIVTPGWSERTAFYGIEQRGTLAGELKRSILQFKSFPWAFFLRGLDAVSNQNTPGSKAVMTAYLILSTTAAGAMLMQTREMLSGKDPRPMGDENWYKFWGQAFLYGGAMGIYGDFLYSANQTRYGSGPIEAMAGPTLGTFLEMTTVLPMTAIKGSIEGKDTHFAARMLQDVKGFTPGGNIWYTKAAMDHLVWQRAMEALSPGYLNRIRRRVRQETGQDWWWEPGQTAPDRAPDLGAVLKR